MTQQPISFNMGGGGLDLITPAINRKPSSAIAGYNYEPRPEGYRRFQGFERTDGQGNPSLSYYYIFNFDLGTVAVSEGDVVTGVTSGATGIALIDGVLETGTYVGLDATGYLVLWALTGTFVDNELLQVSAGNVAQSDGTPSAQASNTDEDNATWQLAAREAHRALINTITGSGDIRGIWHYGGSLYAFRDNIGATAGGMWKAVDTAAGWEAVDLKAYLAFDAGTDIIVATDAITGLTSSATGTVDRVIITTGDWSTNDAEGYLVVSSVTGTWADNEKVQVSAASKADINGTLVTNSLPAGGRYEFKNHNFYGGSGTKMMYGVNGVGNAFEFDGSFMPVITGMVDDTPKHLGLKADALVLAFSGGSLQFSGGGSPHAWTIIAGAGEIGMGDEITGICEEYADGVAIMSRNRTAILYGTDLSQTGDATLKTISYNAGAIEWTVQNLIKPMWYDNTGVRDLTAVQDYGNFKTGEGDGLTGRMKTLLDRKKTSGILPVCSTIVKDQMQYWLFFSDKTAIIISMATGYPNIFPIILPVQPKCAYSVEDANGDELVYFGSDDGYVYSLNTGNDMDGATMEYLLRLSFWNLKSPMLNKRFHKLELEMITASGTGTSLNVSADFSYGNPDNPEVYSEDFTVTGGGGYWDSALWNEFYWSQSVQGKAEVYFDGEGNNIGTALGGEAINEEPHTITGGTYLFSPRRLRR